MAVRGAWILKGEKQILRQERELSGGSERRLERGERSRCSVGEYITILVTPFFFSVARRDTVSYLFFRTDLKLFPY
jgi:hypothetical protein